MSEIQSEWISWHPEKDPVTSFCVRKHLHETAPKEKSWLSFKILYSKQWNWTGRMWIVACAYLIYSLLNFAHFKVQTSFTALRANPPSVPLASILLLKALHCNCTAPHCLSVYFPKGIREHVYWLQTLLLHFVLWAHAPINKSRSLPCSPPCHQSQEQKQNFLSRYLLPGPLPPLYTW